MSNHRLDDRYRTYVLDMRLDRPTRVQVGALTEHRFSPGCYLYTGSARSGLRARLNRHLSDRKNKHWHIDYLLEYADITTVFVSGVPECELNRRLLDRYQMEQPVRTFGASDCNCEAHLSLLPSPEEFAMEELTALEPEQVRS